MSLSIEKNIPLSQYTTLKVGGVADYFVEVFSVDEIKEALQFVQSKKLDVMVLGGGSNVLFSDEGYRGLVIKNSIKGTEYAETGDQVAALFGAGENWDKVVQGTVEKGYWGLENLSLIPGTVGATPVQNVGAYGVEVSSLISNVEAVNSRTSEQRVFSNEECLFGYRDSFFKTKEGKNWAIISVEFMLSKSPKPVTSYEPLQELGEKAGLIPQNIRDTVIEIRLGKFPDLNKVGTAGSFFKNPIIDKQKAEELKEKYPDLPVYEVGEGKVKVSLGWILDNVCNLKGYCEDGVCLYKKQALVLVNENADKASDIDKFAMMVSKKVKEATGIEIEREVRSI